MPGPQVGTDGRLTSYAQNGEDIVLLRAFGSQERGCWVDVGANHPINDSVTKNFADMGWHGINIEPVETFYNLLVEQRPDDVNLLMAVSDQTGTMIFHRNETNLDLSTFDDELVDIYRRRGDVITDVVVPVMRLDEICADHLEGRMIDFLKIDTEGHELNVVVSHDFERFPVRAVCAEATRERLGPLVGALNSRGMEHVNYDGLNAWFVRAEERSTLGCALSTPASPVLDWYHPAVYLRMLKDRDDTIEALRAQLNMISKSGRPSLLERLKALRRNAPSY